MSHTCHTHVAHTSHKPNCPPIADRTAASTELAHFERMRGEDDCISGQVGRAAGSRDDEDDEVSETF